MANTRHGHQIPFSPADSTAEVLMVARCGGPRLCMECREDVYQWMRANNSGKWEDSNFGGKMQESYLEKASRLVFDYVKEHLEKTDTHVTFAPDEVYIVWFSKTLQNWKALLSTTLPDGMYYEVTYNGDKKEAYIDAYKKFDNVCVKDDLIEELREELS